MDAEPLYPEGFHPVILSRTRDLETSAPYYTRANVSVPIKYYLADFNLSSRIPAGLPRQVTGRNCADKEVPELLDDVRPDPYKTDVFILGNSLRRILHDVCPSLRLQSQHSLITLPRNIFAWGFCSLSLFR